MRENNLDILIPLNETSCFAPLIDDGPAPLSLGRQFPRKAATAAVVPRIRVSRTHIYHEMRDREQTAKVKLMGSIEQEAYFDERFRMRFWMNRCTCKREEIDNFTQKLRAKCQDSRTMYRPTEVEFLHYIAWHAALKLRSAFSYPSNEWNARWNACLEVMEVVKNPSGKSWVKYPSPDQDRNRNRARPSLY